MSRIVIVEDRCKGCGLCTLACPYDLVRIAEHFNAKGYRPAELADPDGRCVGCANCAMMCPDVAIIVYRTLGRERSAKATTHPCIISMFRGENAPETGA
jgi:2-oxoglutarate ferredoxin oxidoreductase subunit delta